MSVPLFLFKRKEYEMSVKMNRIISGSPVRPIAVGESALIRETDRLRRTTPVMDVRRVSASEIRFETRNTQYVLKVQTCKSGKENRT